MSEDSIDRTLAEKERHLLEMDYSTMCPNCGGVVFEWSDSDTCRDCDSSTDGDSTKQTTLITDGGTVENGRERVSPLNLTVEEFDILQQLVRSAEQDWTPEEYHAVKSLKIKVERIWRDLDTETDEPGGGADGE